MAKTWKHRETSEVVWNQLVCMSLISDRDKFCSLPVDLTELHHTAKPPHELNCNPLYVPIHSLTFSQRPLFSGRLVKGKESRFLDLISLLCRYNWSKTPLKLEKRPRLLVDSGQVPPLVSGLFTFFSFRDRYHMTMTYQGVRLLEWVEIHTGLPSPFTHNSYNHDYYESNPWLTCLFHTTIAIISLLAAFYLTLLTHILI